MAEFMLILPGDARPAADPALALAACRDPAEIARHLSAGLAALDGIGAGMAAAHLVHGAGYPAHFIQSGTGCLGNGLVFPPPVHLPG